MHKAISINITSFVQFCIYDDRCIIKMSKNAQQYTRNLHNKILEKCTINIEKIEKMCYFYYRRGGVDEINKKRVYAKINR